MTNHPTNGSIRHAARLVLVVTRQAWGIRELQHEENTP